MLGLCGVCRLWLFEVLGYRNIVKVPLALWGYIRELTWSVGFTCGVRVVCTVISLSCVSVSSVAYLGTLHLLCCTDRTMCGGVFAWNIAHPFKGI